jgi:hypothetical protein
VIVDSPKQKALWESVKDKFTTGLVDAFVCMDGGVASELHRHHQWLLSSVEL